MDNTVVAAFDTQQDAQLALDALVDAGFSKDRAKITSSASTGVESTSRTSHSEHQSLGDKIADFFGFGDDDEIYSEAVRRGSYVLTVDAVSEEEADRAQTILYRFSPVDIDQRTEEWRSSGWQPTSGALASRSETVGTSAHLGTTPAAGRNLNEEAVIPVTEESLQVGKREVQRGGVRVITRTVERPVEATVALREEHATVTRRPVDRPVTDADRAFKDQSVEVRETAEEAVVGKTARVVEEVEIGKQSDVREETVRDTVRKTEVDVEQLGSQDRTTGVGSGVGRSRLMDSYSGEERRHAGQAHYAGPERRNSL